MTETHKTRIESSSLPATASTHGLGDLPIGSLQSRAAARSLIEARGIAEEDGMLVVVRHIGATAPLDFKCICNKRVPSGQSRVCHHFGAMRSDKGD